MLNNLFPKEKLLIPIFLFSTFFISDAFAQQIGGFFRNYNAVLTSDDNAYLIGRNRINLDLKFNTGFGDVFISNKIINDYTKQNHDYTLDFNEAYIDIFFTKSDVRIGKQIVNQGRTNGTFITDIISPVDISEFLTIDIRDIKSSIPAIKYNRYFGSNFLELVISPIFQSNILPNPESRWFPFVEIEKQISVSYADSSQDNSYKSFQGMIKWAHRENLKWDLDLFAMWWTLGTPSYKKDLIVTVGPFGPVASIKLAKSYLKSPIFGYSGDLILNENLILSSESAFHINKHFDYLPPLAQNSDLSNLSLAQQQALATQFAQNDDGYLFEKPWLVSMLGIQTNIYGIELTTQFLFEKIFN